MCYCAKIQEMMNLSKERNEAIIRQVDNGSMLVRYFDLFDDYTMQFSWTIDEETDEISKEVQDVLKRYSGSSFEEKTSLDVVQVGVVCTYNTNADYLCKLIELAKSKQLKVKRCTKYIFCGSKVLCITHYHGEFSSAFDCIDSISSWNEPVILNDTAEHKFELAKGIECDYDGKSDSVMFSIGNGHKTTSFISKMMEGVPELIRIDSIQGITEHSVKSVIK